MAKDKLNNLIKFTEYSELQPKQKPTDKTEVGGFAVLEAKDYEKLLKKVSKKTGKDEEELKNKSPKKLKKMLKKIKKEKKKEKPQEEKEEKKETRLNDKDTTTLDNYRYKK